MKTHNRRLPAMLLLVAAIAIPAAAQAPAPFKGVFKGADTETEISNTTAGGGNGTLLGEFTLTHVTMFSTLTGSGHLVAANGDTIDTTSVVSPDFSTFSLGYATFVEIHTITAGTGRFAGAQGSFVVERTHLVESNADDTHVTFGSYRGTITLAAGNK
jgi:hypothetical protein